VPALVERYEQDFPKHASSEQTNPAADTSRQDTR
jgi:hypothetical protein